MQVVDSVCLCKSLHDIKNINRCYIFCFFSLSTTLCLVYTPQVVALAVILLAVKLSNQNIRDFMLKPHADWWRPLYAEAEEKDLEGNEFVTIKKCKDNIWK